MEGPPTDAVYTQHVRFAVGGSMNEMADLPIRFSAVVGNGRIWKEAVDTSR
jgi:hypothetical protein